MSLTDHERDALKQRVYTPFSEVVAELQRRREDKELRKKVEDFLGHHILKPLEGAPKAVLARSIFTPNFEFSYFMDVVGHAHLEPLLLEYHGKFVAKNQEKYHLCRLFMFSHVGKKGGMLYNTAQLVNFNTEEGKDMSEVRTISGASLVDFHHRLLESKYPGTEQRIIPFTEWFNETRYLTDHYYFYFFALFIYHGVLFENFLADDKEESAFIKSHVLPSFEKASEYFGVKPLIMPLLPIENEKFRTWLSYPKDVNVPTVY